MCEFHSLSQQIFKEENSSIFSQCLELYFFKTNEENSQDFQDLNEKEMITQYVKCCGAVCRPVSSHQCTVY